MKLATHIAVGASLAGSIALLLGCSYPCTWYAMLTAMFANIAIDLLGHESRPYPRRTAVSHNPLGPLLLTLPLLVPLLQAPLSEAVVAAIASLTGAYSHLLLDAVTEGGIYRSPFSRRRVRLASYPYNHPLLNNAAILIAAGILLAVIAGRLAATLGG